MFDEENEPTTSNDTENATHFHPEEASPNLQATFQRLHHYNTGEWNGPRRENKEVTHRLDNFALFDAIAGHAELTPYQKTAGRELFDNLPLQTLGYGAELIAYCTCIYVSKLDGREHVFTGGPLNDDPFLHIAAKQNYENARIFSCLDAIAACDGVEK